jgi:glycine/D-amino acid oxidase-like deaminating enzyme
VIGGGVAGSCVAYWLAHEGIDTLLVERDDMNLQASGANAGSLHVQLLSFDFGAGAPPAGNRAADTLPLGPASVRLWQEIELDTGEDLEIKVTGGLMLGESERDIEFLRARSRWRRAAAIEAELIGGNELRRMEPCIGETAIAAEWCPGEGKINPLRGTYAVIARAKELGAAFPPRHRCAGDRARRQRLEGDDQPRRDSVQPDRQCRRAVGGARGGAGRRDHPGARGAAADGRDRADGAHPHPAGGPMPAGTSP